MSPFACEDTFHQKLSVPGPLTVVSIHVCWLSITEPLCAASIPSWVTFVTTPQTASPPLLHGVQKYSVAWDRASDKARFGTTIVTSELLLEFGSASLRTTLALLVSGSPTTVGVMTIVTVADDKALIVPKLAVTTPPLCEDVPWLATADTNVAPAGRTLVN